MTFHIYDDEGRIVRVVEVQGVEEAFLQVMGPDEHVGVGSANDARQYVVDEMLVDRPAMRLGETRLALDGLEHRLVDDVPAGTQITVEHIDRGTIDDGALDFTPTRSGRFDFALHPPFPWQDLFFTVTVA